MEGLVPGRIVYFVFGEGDLENVVRARASSGARGNALHPGDVYPAMIVRVFDQSSGMANLKVSLDGPDTYWATSAHYDASTAVGHTWHWMFDGQQTRYTPASAKAGA
jgi:hypothetical protein